MFKTFRFYFEKVINFIKLEKFKILEFILKIFIFIIILNLNNSKIIFVLFIKMVRNVSFLKLFMDFPFFNFK